MFVSGESLLIIAISAIVCVITTLSLSALCTNGEVKGGNLNIECHRTAIVSNAPFAYNRKSVHVWLEILRELQFQFRSQTMQELFIYLQDIIDPAVAQKLKAVATWDTKECELFYFLAKQEINAINKTKLRIFLTFLIHCDSMFNPYRKYIFRNVFFARSA